ncbi:asparagine synthase (glutamine-hydrolyzing) [Alphaproteobacteria bacterium]|nr:asparagine synthase (glutamine-hydrolyzing) [Alphaproteobacteria bacterium]
MCGFVGYLTLDKSAAAKGTVANLMEKSKQDALKTIERRGPDAEGEWQDHHLWLGHRRLSIVDTSTRGLQPMRHGSHIIAFNGMIYNYHYIREILIQKGYKFQTDTDTEVIIAGWAEWNEALLPRLQGMFSFAIWDQPNKSLFLVRDRFGKKPLYYRNWRNDLAFGSRFDALEALTENVTLGEDALAWLLTLKYIPEPFSAADDIKKVPPGHFVRVNTNGQKIIQWHEFQPDSDTTNAPYSEQKQKLRDNLDQAVSDRLVSDVPIACFLSGGIDSAIIASIARNHGPIDTFTAGFDDNFLDESKMARETAKHLGTNHHEIRLKNNDQLSVIEQLFSTALDEPFGDSSALPSLFVSKAIKNQATVALSGDGADELFGGYRKYQGELAVHTWRRLPRAIRLGIKIIINNLPKARAKKLTDKFRQLDRFINGAELGVTERHAVWMEVASSAPDIQKFIQKSKHEDLIKILNEIFIPSGMDSLSATLLRDIKTVLVSDMLVKIDRTSMDNGLEIRSPFLDHRVVNMSLAIEGRQKIAWGQGKKILREAFKNDLPQKVFATPKRGFEIPLNNWLLGPLQDQLKAALAPEFLSYNKLDPKLGLELQKGIEQGQLPHAELGWSLMSIYHWQKQRGFS